MKALDTKTKFSGRIRFDNLSNEELGLLLTAIDLPPECAHKIGMGKPLGLGSIRVTPTLKMINRKLRYNPLSIDNDSKEDPSEVDYKKEFAAILYSALDQKHSDIWQIDRLSKLKAMLTFNDTNKTEKWIKGTNYMDFAEDKDKYLNRHVLPNPLEVIELNK
ncbi:MAG: hypothetical protein IPH98_17910 [Saprospiraceae bacterium]|nr:hypothetical protein [Candidatus Defluviibacterium haderslevense]